MSDSDRSREEMIQDAVQNLVRNVLRSGVGPLEAIGIFGLAAKCCAVIAVQKGDAETLDESMRIFLTGWETEVEAKNAESLAKILH